MDIVISDLDGTLLDHGSYSFEAARPGMDILKSKRVPLVFCTSKTRSESLYWRRATENDHPFIVENGGAVVIPNGYFQFPIPSASPAESSVIIRLGAPYRDLVECLEEAAVESQCQVKGFHEMTAKEIAEVCNLSANLAALAKAREFDEPFLILNHERTPALLAGIERRRKRWTRGGRFYHVLGNNDKAAAVNLLVDIYRQCGQPIRSIGIGDGLNDAAFLNAVDVAILIRTPWVEELQAIVPKGQPTTMPGPQGWNEAMTRLFQ